MSDAVAALQECVEREEVFGAVVADGLECSVFAVFGVL